jgi:hypothetical protein
MPHEDFMAALSSKQKDVTDGETAFNNQKNIYLETAQSLTDEGLRYDTQYAKVTVSYMKGYALFQLRDYKEAKVNFEYVIENGNTLPIVEMAKQLLIKID